MNGTYLRADGKTTHGVNRRFGRYIVGLAWLPPKLYTRAEVGYYRDAKRGDGAVSVTIGRVSTGWHWGPKT